MATRSLTIFRNKEIVGRNSKSYTDKHPENPIALRPIRDACKATGKYSYKLRAKISALKNCSRPVIARGIAKLTLR